MEGSTGVCRPHSAWKEAFLQLPKARHGHCGLCFYLLGHPWQPSIQQACQQSFHGEVDGVEYLTVSCRRYGPTLALLLQWEPLCGLQVRIITRAARDLQRYSSRKEIPPKALQESAAVGADVVAEALRFDGRRRRDLRRPACPLPRRRVQPSSSRDFPTEEAAAARPSKRARGEDQPVEEPARPVPRQKARPKARQMREPQGSDAEEVYDSGLRRVCGGGGYLDDRWGC